MSPSDSTEHGKQQHTEKKETARQLAIAGGIGLSGFGLLSVSCQTGSCSVGFESILTLLALLSVLIGGLGLSVAQVFG